MLEEVRRVARIGDHRTRVREAARLMTELQAAVVETARMRRESIAWLREHEHSMADVAKLMGVSRARVAQLREAGPPPERAFLGAELVTIAVPERPGGRRLVARADAATGERLLNLAHSLQLEASLDYIPASGEVDLNREDLLVVCGPKTSLVIADVLGGDPRLAFETVDSDRWGITDRKAGTVYVSPTDDETVRHEDVAYLGRLPRPDRQGTFLLIAGVHAIGSLGAAQYLDEHLADMYTTVGREPFSMVIGCEYDPDAEGILATTALTEPLPHQD